METTIMKNKIIMIFGASGVIGTHFLWSLRGSGNTIYALHNRQLPEHLIETNFNDKTHFIKGDLTDISFLNSLHMADIIIHAATYSSPSLFMENPIKTIQLNTTVTIELLKKLKKGGKFLFISSSEVYSGIENDFINETQIGTTTPEHPRACYIEGKRCGEAICINSGKDVKIIRLAHVYGDGTRPHDSRVLYNFINEAIIYGGITMRDDGSAKRSYCYAADAIQMMWNILNNGKQVIYNIGGNDIITIKKLAIEISTLTDAFVVCTENKHDNTSPSSAVLDMSKYNNEFGEYKYTSLKEGLEKVIIWQRKY